MSCSHWQWFIGYCHLPYSFNHCFTCYEYMMMALRKVATFKVSTAVRILVDVFWSATPYSVVEGHHRFRGPCCLHFTVKMEAATRLHVVKLDLRNVASLVTNIRALCRHWSSNENKQNLVITITSYHLKTVVDKSSETSCICNIYLLHTMGSVPTWYWYKVGRPWSGQVHTQIWGH
jgi:hypothetical protein